MDPLTIPTPNKFEVERQLRRILAHDLFASRPKETQLLEFLVKSALSGRAVCEKDILVEIFPLPGYEQGSTIARTTATHLRKRLNEYYGSSGREDTLVISLGPNDGSRAIAAKAGRLRRPAHLAAEEGKFPGKTARGTRGSAYRPTFLYNPAHESAKEYALGSYYLRCGGPHDMNEAIKHFAKVAKLQPGHGEALLGMAEALCSYALLYRGEPHPQRKEYLEIAEDILRKTAALAPESWRTRSAYGLFFFCQGDIELARQEYQAAMKIDALRTVSSQSSRIMLSRAGHSAEAIEASKDFLGAHIDDPVAHANHGIVLFATKHFEEAEALFQQALRMDRNCWIAHVGIVALYLCVGKQDRAIYYAKRLELLMEPSDYEYFISRVGLKLDKP